ncbi:hypothetical protein ABTX24_18665 [Nocardioides sp. NPDC127514]|uniref:hypothetical protein n=1 Tax=unclassified Nocardioides TaxID=2615069 RepID=UPI0033182C49
MATAVDQIASFLPIALPIAALVGLVLVGWLIWHLWHEVEAMDRARMVWLVAGVIFLILYLGLDALDKFGISLPPPP